jgi:hypothetical protein
MERRGDKGIKTARNKDIKTPLLADDQVTVADSEEALQISIHKLETVIFKYELKISKNKTKKEWLSKEEIQSEVKL